MRPDMRKFLILVLALGGCAAAKPKSVPAEQACDALCGWHHGCLPIKYDPCTCTTLQLKATLHPAATLK